jgi:hypothetical protein
VLIHVLDHHEVEELLSVRRASVDYAALNNVAHHAIDLDDPAYQISVQE